MHVIWSVGHPLLVPADANQAGAGTLLPVEQMESEQKNSTDELERRTQQKNSADELEVPGFLETRITLNHHPPLVRPQGFRGQIRLHAFVS